MTSRLIPKAQPPIHFIEHSGSKGILDDYAVRKNVATKEGTIEKVPVNDSDIVNKKYVSDGYLKLDGSNANQDIDIGSYNLNLNNINIDNKINFANGTKIGNLDTGFPNRMCIDCNSQSFEFRNFVEWYFPAVNPQIELWSSGYNYVEINNGGSGGTAGLKITNQGGANIILKVGSITDSSGAISFDNENLTTTGNITGATITGTNLNINTSDGTIEPITIQYDGQETAPGEAGINILSYCKTGGAYYGGDINIKTLSQGAYGSANVNIWAQQGGYSGTDTGKIYIVAKKDSGDSRTGNSIHIYSEMYGADAGTLFLQEQAGEIVCGDTSDHSGTKFYLKGDVGGIVASPKVCEFVGQNARDAYGGGSSGGDSLFEATDGGDSTGGNGNGGDGGDILFRAGLHGNKSGTGTNGADGNCKFGVETTTNYLEIKGDGELALYGTARVKRFVQINATATKGVGTNPATEGEIGLNGCMIFSKTIDENIGSVITIPNDMDRSVAPTIRIGWASPVTTGNIKWEVKSLYRSENEDISSTTADDTIDVVDAVSSTSNGYQYTSFTLSAPSSTDRVVQIRITRLGSDASDTADDVANLLGFLFEYTSNKLGTAT